MMTGSGPSPASSASRSLCRPPQTTIRSKAVSAESPALRAVTTTSEPDVLQPDDFVPEQDFRAFRDRVGGERLGHLREIDDRRRGRVQRGDTADVRFQFAQFLGADHREPRGHRWPVHALRCCPDAHVRLRRARPEPCRTRYGGCRAARRTPREDRRRGGRARPWPNRADSRGPRGRRRCCARSGGRRAGPPSRTG